TRVFASDSVSGGRGPNSICLRTCSMARSPLNAVTIGVALSAGRAVVEMLPRARGGGSSFGHAVRGTTATKRHSKRSKPGQRFCDASLWLIVICSLRFARALHVPCLRSHQTFSNRTQVVSRSQCRKLQTSQ